MRCSKTFPLRRSTSSRKSLRPVRFSNRDRQRDALDKLIAAHALALEVTLVTNNEADFAADAALRVENWVN